MLTAEAYPELPSCFDDHATPRRENGHPRPSDPLSTRQRWRRARPCRRLEVGVSLSTPIRVPVYFQLTTLTRRILRPDSRTHAVSRSSRRGCGSRGAGYGGLRFSLKNRGALGWACSGGARPRAVDKGERDAASGVGGRWWVEKGLEGRGWPFSRLRRRRVVIEARGKQGETLWMGFGCWHACNCPSI